VTSDKKFKLSLLPFLKVNGKKRSKGCKASQTRGPYRPYTANTIVKYLTKRLKKEDRKKRQLRSLASI
jgi:hypothetical protein